ncbi:MAG: MerR family transcriptional regulator [Shimia sp.]|uniref:MerR family transcriptional regulator n=1 Tax=Shimia sp. TaxID=1954381 RepID=UPI001B20E8DC|nr:MerR family transcriptional regulator [Shimia sp.]MBO6898902.1 MerR family transcriptional regulator [Shimia sp.]
MAKSREAFRTISEVAEWLDVQTHVLRFWESKFSQVKPVKRAGGRRYYRPQDMELLGGLKKLLHEDGMPIKDAQQLLREKGVKHVASLSRPVDEENTASGGEDVVQEMAQKSVDTSQDTAQAETAPDGVLNDAPEAVASTEAIAEDQGTEPSVEADSEEENANVLSSDRENDIEELPEDPQATASAHLEPDATATPTSDDSSTDIPEDLLVKIEDDVPPISTDQGQMATDVRRSAPPSSSPLNTLDDSAALEQPSDDAVTAPSNASNDLPPMNDLFAALETSDTSPQSEDTEVHVASDDNAAHEAPTAEPVTDTPAAAQDAPQAVPSNTETDAPVAPAEVKAEASALPSAGPSTQNTPVASAPAETSTLSATETPAAAPAEPTTTAQKLGAQSEESSVTPAASSSSSEAPEAAVAREDARDDFLLMLTKPVTVSSQDASRAASLLARLEALQSKAG